MSRIISSATLRCSAVVQKISGPSLTVSQRRTRGLAVVLTGAAIWPERRLVVVALLAYLSFSAPRMVFHLAHLHGASGQAASVLLIVVMSSVALPLALLVGVLRTRAAPAAFSPPG